MSSIHAGSVLFQAPFLAPAFSASDEGYGCNQILTNG